MVHERKVRMLGSRLMARAAGGLVIALAVVPISQAYGQQPSDILQDSKFIRTAAGDNLMEIRLGEVAGTKATTPAVQQFGRKMVTDHNNLQSQLTTMVATTGRPFTPAMTTDQEQEVNRLQT